MNKIFTAALLPRILRFRKQIVLLWRGFWSPATPLYLKFATFAAAAYLVSPIDLIPDIVPGLGLIDDLIIVPLILGWVLSRLPQDGQAAAAASAAASTPEGPIIEGTARRA